MKRLWLIFAQTVTICLAVLFVVATLKPQWLPASEKSAGSRISIVQAPPAEHSSQAARTDSQVSSFHAAVLRAAPAVISINTSATHPHPFADDPLFDFFFGDLGSQTRSGLGSGVIISPEGYILTNHHVVQGADAIEAVLPDRRSATARIIGVDAETDLAVLKIDLDDLPAMTLGDSASLHVGDAVLAIGNPFGVGQTVTSGIVSALERSQLGLNTFEDFIQTDAAINPGNSGGALVDSQGHLIGINTAIFSPSGGSMGIGFAIPTTVASQVLQSIVEHGRVVRGWIGMEPQELTTELAQSLNIQTSEGVVVAGVLKSGPAAQAGIRPGDVVTQINDEAVTSPRKFLTQIAALTPGQRAHIEWQRRGETLQAELTPSERPSLQRRRF